MYLEQEAANWCSTHNSEYVAIDINPQFENKAKFLCLQCLITAPSENQCIKSLDEAEIYLSDIKIAFLQQKQEQRKKNLETLEDLASSIQSLKIFNNSTFNKIIDNIKQYQALIVKEQEELINQLEKVNLNNYFTQKYELSQIQYKQGKQLLEIQLQRLRKQDEVDQCLQQLSQIEDSIISLHPGSQMNNKNRKQIQRTPYLHILCQTHQMEIIYFDLNYQTLKENKISCIQCASTNLGQLTDLLSAQKQWQELENYKKSLLEFYLDYESQQLLSIKSQLNKLQNNFELKIKSIYHTLENHYLMLQDKTQKEINNMNKDWLTLSRDEILLIAHSLCSPQHQETLHKQFQEEYVKNSEVVNKLIKDLFIYLIEALYNCTEIYNSKTSKSQEENKRHIEINQSQTPLNQEITFYIQQLKQIIIEKQQLSEDFIQKSQIMQDNSSQISQQSHDHALIESLTKQLQILQDESQQKNQRISSLDQIIFEKDQQIVKLTLETNFHRTKLESECSQIENLKRSFNNAIKEIEEKNSVIDQLKEKASLDQQKIENLKKNNQEHQFKMSELERKLQGKLEKLESLHQRPYEIMKECTLKQSDDCWAIAINSEQSYMIAGCGSKISVFKFEQGKLNQKQILTDHATGFNITTLYFMIKCNRFVSGTMNQLGIWNYNNVKKQWQCQQLMKQAHSNWVNRVIVNINEDLIISCSNDYTIKFWMRKNEWVVYQTLTCHKLEVWSICLNQSSTQLVSCGNDKLIIITEQGSDQKWKPIQIIEADQYGCRICYIDCNLIAFQPDNGTKMETYQLNQLNNQFVKSKDVALQNEKYCQSLFPMAFHSQKQLLMVKNGFRVNLIRKQQNDYIVEQSINFESEYIFGEMTADFEYLVTWDQKNRQFQVRKQK